MSATSREIEREVEVSRAEVRNTLDALRERVSIGTIVDETAHYLRDNGGGATIARLGEQIRANPLPLALVGVGLAWLMSGRGQPNFAHTRNGRGYENDFDPDSPRYAYRTHGAAGALYGESDGDESHTGEASLFPDLADMRDGATTAAAGVSDSVSSAGEAIGSAARRAANGMHAVGDATARAIGGAGRASTRAYEGATDYAGDAYEGAAGYASGAYGGASRYARGAYRGTRQTLVDVLEREPLVIGALGVAVGAAIGAMLPRTEIEDRYMGDASRRVKDDARDIAGKGLARGRVVVEEAVEAAREEAQAQGLMPEQLVEKAQSVVTAAEEGAREELPKQS
jgi:hypothetical protein